VLVEHVPGLALDRHVAVLLCLLHLHDLAVHRETIHQHSLLCRLLVVEDHKGLALALEAALGDDIDDRTEVVKDGVECALEFIDLDALLEVADLGLLTWDALHSATDAGASATHVDAVTVSDRVNSKWGKTYVWIGTGYLLGSMAAPPVPVEAAGPPEITPSILSAMFEQLCVLAEQLQVGS
jgi:hypothetical protein